MSLSRSLSLSLWANTCLGLPLAEAFGQWELWEDCSPLSVVPLIKCPLTQTQKADERQRGILKGRVEGGG